MYNQGGLQDIRETSGAAAMNYSALQSSTLPMQFGDITRVNLGKGSETPKNSSFNAGELFFDNNAVGLNPFKTELPKTATKEFIG